jgi:hypothetical protein
MMLWVHAYNALIQDDINANIVFKHGGVFLFREQSWTNRLMSHSLLGADKSVPCAMPSCLQRGQQAGVHVFKNCAQGSPKRHKLRTNARTISGTTTMVSEPQ